MDERFLSNNYHPIAAFAVQHAHHTQWHIYTSNVT